MALNFWDDRGVKSVGGIEEELGDLEWFTESDGIAGDRPEEDVSSVVGG